jgi:hypothetical protein
MYNCWNEALEYLIKKCGETLTHTGCHYQGGKNTSKMVRTYKSENVKEHDKIIVVLMNQYYYCISAKKELFNKLLDLGVIKSEDSLTVSN